MLLFAATSFFRIQTMKTKTRILVFLLICTLIICANTVNFAFIFNALNLKMNTDWIHFVEFFILSSYVFRYYLNAISAFSLVIIACLVEFSQELIEYRYFEWLDMAFNVGGVLLGVYANDLTIWLKNK